MRKLIWKKGIKRTLLCYNIPVESYWLCLAVIESGRLYSFYEELTTWPEYLKMSQLHFLFNFTLSSRKIESFQVVGWRPWPAPLQPFQLIWPKLILKICTKLWPIIASILQNTFDQNQILDFYFPGANQSCYYCACQGAQTWSTTDQVRFEKGPAPSLIYVWCRFFYQKKVLPFFELCLKIFAYHKKMRGAKNDGDTPQSSQNNIINKNR